MKSKSLIYVLLTLAISIATAKGAEVIVATNLTYPDAVMAQQIASLIGAQVVLVEPKPVDLQATLNKIVELKPEKVYIFGGPIVVSEELENELKLRLGEENVIRIWGYTRFGTAAKVFKYFLLGNCSEIMLVADNYDGAIVGENKTLEKFISKAAEYAIINKIPMLIVPKDVMPAEIKEILELCNAKKIIAIGNFKIKVSEELKDLKAKVEENVSDEEKLAKEIENKAIKKAEILVIAAVSQRETKEVPKGVSILVESQDQISQVISKVKEILKEVKLRKILVVGKPDLAVLIYGNLTKEGIQNVTCPVCRGKRVHEEIKDLINEVREKYEKIKVMLEERIKRNLNLTYMCKQVLLELPEEVKEKIKMNESDCEKLGANITKVTIKIELEGLKAKWKLKWEKNEELPEIEKEVKTREHVKGLKSKEAEKIKSAIIGVCEKIDKLTIPEQTKKILKDYCNQKEKCFELIEEFKEKIREGDVKGEIEIRKEIGEKCRVEAIGKKIVEKVGTIEKAEASIIENITIGETEKWIKKSEMH